MGTHCPLAPAPGAATALAGLALALALHGAAPAQEHGRRDLLDRHGHVIAHLPPLRRDAACAPDLVGAVRRATEASAPAGTAGPVATTIDGALQVLAQQVVQRGIERLALLSSPSGPAAVDSGPLRVGMKRAGVVRAVHPDALELELGASGVVGLLPLPADPACPGHAPASTGARFQPGQRLRVQVLSIDEGGTGPGERTPRRAQALLALQPQAALLALEPRSREVLALVGGYRQRFFDFDRATQGRRQAGSTWKPLVFAAALQSRRYTLLDTVEDLPRLYGGWSPRNFSGSYRGPMRLRRALSDSVNTVAVHLLSEVGPPAVIALAARLGIPAATVPRDLTQALGTALVSPLQLAGAYATFADTLHGRYRPPRLLREAAAAPDTEALPPAVAYLVHSLLESVVREGSAREAGRQVGVADLAGKTGTTTQGHDAWFVGYHADLLCVVWVGDDDGPGVGARSGAETALPLWIEFMKGARSLAGIAVGTPAPLPRPPGVREVPLPDGATELLLDP